MNSNKRKLNGPLAGKSGCRKSEVSSLFSQKKLFASMVVIALAFISCAAVLTDDSIGSDAAAVDVTDGLQVQYNSTTKTLIFTGISGLGTFNDSDTDFEARFLAWHPRDSTGTAYASASAFKTEVSDCENISMSIQITGIGDYCFSGLKKVREVFIPSGVTKVHVLSFYDMYDHTNQTGLTSISVDALNKYYADERGALLAYCKANTGSGDDRYVECSTDDSPIGMKVVVVPVGERSYVGTYDSFAQERGSYMAPLGTRDTPTMWMGDYCMMDCRYLGSIQIPDTVVQIGDSAFKDCLSLVAMKLPSTWSDTSNITNAIQGYTYGVQQIGTYLFQNCEDLEMVEFGSGITNIPEGTFAGCGALKIISVDATSANMAVGVFGYSESSSQTPVTYGYAAYDISGSTLAYGTTITAGSSTVPYPNGLYVLMSGDVPQHTDAQIKTSVQNKHGLWAFTDHVQVIYKFAYAQADDSGWYITLATDATVTSTQNRVWAAGSGSTTTNILFPTDITQTTAGGMTQAEYVYQMKIAYIPSMYAVDAHGLGNKIIVTNAVLAYYVSPLSKDQTGNDGIIYHGGKIQYYPTGNPEQVILDQGMTEVAAYAFAGGKIDQFSLTDLQTAASWNALNARFGILEWRGSAGTLNIRINLNSGEWRGYAETAIYTSECTTTSTVQPYYVKQAVVFEEPNEYACGKLYFAGGVWIDQAGVLYIAPEEPDQNHPYQSNLWLADDYFASPSVQTAATYSSNKVFFKLMDYDSSTMDETWYDSSKSALQAMLKDGNDGTNAYKWIIIGDTLYVHATGTSINNLDSVGSSFTSSIKKVVFSGTSLTSLGAVLNGKSSVTNVYLPTSLTTIGANAFAGTGLIKVYIPRNVTSIDSTSFKGCASLKQAYIPDKETEGVFSGTYTSLINDELSMMILDATTKKVIVYPAALTGSLQIPDGYSIGDNAFYGSNLSSVDLNETGTIGDYAFQNSKLKNVTIPDTVTSIGKSAFASTYMSSLTLGTGLVSGTTETPVTNIGSGAFSGNSGLVFIYIKADNTPPSLSLDSNTYLGVTNYWHEFGLADTTNTLVAGKIYTNSVLSFAACGTNLEYYTFVETGTTIVKVTDPTQDNEMWDDDDTEHWAGSPWKDKTYILEVILADGVKTIGKDAFKGCSYISSVTGTEDLVSIGEGAFEGCTGLTDIGSTLTDLETIGDRALRSTQIESINLPSIKKIGDYAFAKYSSGAVQTNTTLKTVVLSDNAIEVGAHAFDSCAELSSIGTNGLKYATKVGESAFAGCVKLNPGDISKVTTLGASAFKGTTIASVTTSDSLASIPDYVFQDCLSLAEVYIGNSVASIGKGAFNVTGTNVSALTDIVFGAGSSAGNVTLVATGNEEDHSFPGMNSTDEKWYANGDGSLTYIPATVSKGDFYTTTIAWIDIGSGDTNKVQYRMASTALVIRGNAATAAESVLKDFSIVEGVTDAPWKDAKTMKISGVAVISTNAFTGMPLLSADISDVTTISANAFKGCVSLSEIDLSGVTTVMADAFEGCTSITAASLTTATTIGNSSFKDCTGLTTVTFPAATSIGTSAFEGCTNIETFVFPASLTSIGDRAFYGCEKLATVTFLHTASDGLTIGADAFNGTAIENMLLPDKVTVIGNGAFSNISSLRKVRINSANVISIGKGVFAESAGTESIRLYLDAADPTSPTAGEDINNKNATPVVNESTLSAFLTLADAEWTHSEVMKDFTVSSSIAVTGTKNLDMNGKVIDTPGTAVYTGSPVITDSESVDTVRYHKYSSGWISDTDTDYSEDFTAYTKGGAFILRGISSEAMQLVDVNSAQALVVFNIEDAVTGLTTEQKTFTYTGLEHVYASELDTITIDGVELTKDTHYTVTYEDNICAGKGEHAGEPGTGKVILTSTSESGMLQEIAITINPAVLTATLTVTPETIVFGEEYEIDIAVTGFVHEETKESIIAAGGRYVDPVPDKSPTSPGTYVIAPKDGAVDNYRFEYVSDTLVIEVKNVTITFHKSDETIDYTLTVAAGSAITLPDADEVANKKFEGWYSDTAFETLFGKAGRIATVPENDTDLYPKYVISAYNVVIAYADEDAETAATAAGLKLIYNGIQLSTTAGEANIAIDGSGLLVTTVDDNHYSVTLDSDEAQLLSVTDTSKLVYSPSDASGDGLVTIVVDVEQLSAGGYSEFYASGLSGDGQVITMSVIPETLGGLLAGELSTKGTYYRVDGNTVYYGAIGNSVVKAYLWNPAEQEYVGGAGNETEVKEISQGENQKVTAAFKLSNEAAKIYWAYGSYAVTGGSVNCTTGVMSPPEAQENEP